MWHLHCRVHCQRHRRFVRLRIRRHRDDDLFFTLTARQMAKLFRTKRSLCNQPMTLRVNKTMFCCHAVLLEETSETDSDKKDDSNNEEEEDNSLSLFSVVVALAPTTQQSALPFSSFWDVGGFGEDTSDLERYIRQGGANKSSRKTSAQSEENDADNKPDKSLTAKQTISSTPSTRRCSRAACASSRPAGRRSALLPAACGLHRMHRHRRASTSQRFRPPWQSAQRHVHYRAQGTF